MVWTSPKISVNTVPCESQNIQYVILQREITKENTCRIRCIVASSKWTKVIVCFKFTYLECYTAVRLWSDSLHRRPAKSLDANSVWLWPKHYRCCDWPVAWDHVCVLVMDTLKTCSEMMFIYMIHRNILRNCQCNFDACNGYFLFNIKCLNIVHVHFWCFDVHKVVQQH